MHCQYQALTCFTCVCLSIGKQNLKPEMPGIGSEGLMERLTNIPSQVPSDRRENAVIDDVIP